MHKDKLFFSAVNKPYSCQIREKHFSPKWVTRTDTEALEEDLICAMCPRACQNKTKQKNKTPQTGQDSLPLYFDGVEMLLPQLFAFESGCDGTSLYITNIHKPNCEGKLLLLPHSCLGASKKSVISNGLIEGQLENFNSSFMTKSI